MNILMLNPPFLGKFSRTSRSPAVTKGGTLYYPFWLAYATGVLEDAGFDVRLIDAPADGLSIDDVINKVRGFTPQLIVLDTSTPSIYNDVKMGEKLKGTFPDSFVVLAGTHVSALPDESLRLSKEINAVARREYDYTLRDLAHALREERDLQYVEGLSFRQGSDIIHNPDRLLIENMDELPFVTKVYKKHLNIKNYFFAAANYPMVMIITGRGCPNRCFFCVYPQTFHSRMYRMRSPENIVDEFEWITNNLPQVREIGIEDDTFTAKHNHAREVSRLIVKRGIKIKWYCNVRPDLDYDTLRIMKYAGCRLVTTGFESGNQEILNRMHKDLKLETVREFMKNTKRAGIMVHGCIMMGTPGETEETIQESIEFANELNCDSMQYYPLYVYPGTEAYEWARINGYLTTNDYSKWVTKEGYHNCVINLPELSTEKLIDLCDKALRDYHLRPSYLWMKLKQAIKQPREGMRTAKSAVAFVRYLCQKVRNDKDVENITESTYEEWDELWRKAGASMTLAGKLITRGKQKAIKKLLEDKKVSSAIDVGCGLGHTLSALKDLGYDVRGIDASEAAVDICRSKGLPAYQVALENENGQYDLVFSDGLIEHFQDFYPHVRKMAEISQQYVMIAQTDHETLVVRLLQFMEKMFRPHNIKELDYKIRDFIEAFEKNGCAFRASKPVFFKGYKVILFEKEKKNVKDLQAPSTVSN